MPNLIPAMSIPIGYKELINIIHQLHNVNDKLIMIDKTLHNNRLGRNKQYKNIT
mgnify:CR=1 FL=1